MTPAIAVVAAAAIVVLSALLLPPVLRKRRRRRTLATPLSDLQRSILRRTVRAAAALPAGLQERLEGLVITFLAEKQFVGCNGLVIDDEIRTAIAAQACVLLLGRPGRVYDELKAILVYPGTFWVDDEVEDESGVVTPRRRELSGEAWDSHRIILSWEDIADNAFVPADGYNIVLHEFAHYLEAEGVGLAPGGTDAKRTLDAWLGDLQREFATFNAAVGRDDSVFMDPYAAEDEAEFFAVATEDFLERPAQFRAACPGLHALLREFYGFDPAEWQDY